ncbi:MAG TPA: diaminopimelate decarboxylase [Polyangiaceae bacterium]|nr:diaminopimelate decarboxylase [Polyangiaceae bacterium]
MGFSRDPGGRALLGGVPLEPLLGRAPTPFYAYDLDGVAGRARRLAEGFGARDHRIFYAIKANSAGPLLARLRDEGLGVDVVSGGELRLCLRLGFLPERIIFSGVGKSDAELDLALGAGPEGIGALQAESVEELGRVEARARALGRTARVSLRLNPDVEAGAHAHIATGHDEAKFGIPFRDLDAALDEVARRPALRLGGLATHIGSQMTSIAPYERAAERLCEAARRWLDRGFGLDFLDFGGGYGVDYGGGCEAEPADFARAALGALDRAGLGRLRAHCEPGRALVAPEGALVTRVVQVKRWRHPETAGWLFTDAGMHTLLRPALYGARHRIEALGAPPGRGPEAAWRLAGPVCESSDEFGTYRLPDPPPEALVVRDAGAYGYTMASLYNGHGLPSEVFLEGGRVRSVRRALDAEAWAEERAKL